MKDDISKVKQPKNWTKKALKVVNVVVLSKFCCLFSLRQGTILIAVIELSLTSFSLFLLLLGVAHAQDIVTVVSSDLQQLEQLEENNGNTEESSSYILNNERKMQVGQHLAFIVVFIVWSGLMLTSLHFLSCILLLYGVIRSSPNFLIPWTFTALISLISGCFFFVTTIFIPLEECKLKVLAGLLFFYGLEFYSWLVVFSHYQELRTRQLKNLGKIAYIAKEIEKTPHPPQAIRT